MRPIGTRLTRGLALLAAAVVATSVLALTPPAASASARPAAPAAVDARVRPAADLSQFRAGNIISDAVFTNSSTMSASQVQTFLQSKVSACRSGYVCLKDFQQSTPNKSADRYCNGYSGSSGESAATIIAKVAQSCGINPQVLVVMLQKEQGLVLDTWPVGAQYAAAMGQACPDTAPCDPSFAGFFAQVYGGARQMKIYLEGVYFTWYAPGRTWNILYNPNEACGSSPVYIENAATSALYYYTPYQPNAAALAAGYGTGNSCSAYGNRNFFNFFTDWFGSTQVSGGSDASLAVAYGGNQVYLVMSGTKYHVVSSLDLAALTSRLGSFRWVSASLLDGIKTGPDVTRYVHDPRTGTLYLLDTDGTKHRLPTAAAVASYGYAFGSFVNIPASLADAFTTGAEVSDIFTPYGSGDVYRMTDSGKRHVWDSLALAYAFGGRPAYIATMEPASSDRLPEGATLFAPNSLVRAQSENDVYLTTSTGTIVHIPSFGLAADFGARRYSVVTDAALSRSTRTATGLTPFVSCGGTVRVLDGASLRSVNGADTGGVTPTPLQQGECDAFPATAGSPAVSAPLLVQGSDGAVYTLDRGSARHVLRYADLVALNGSRPLQIVSWSDAALQAVGIGAPYLPDGAFVSFRGKPEVYRLTGGSLHQVRAFSTLLALGNGAVPPIATLPASSQADFTIGAPLLTESVDFVQFAGAGEVYRYQDGALRHVLSYATLVALGGGQLPSILTLDPGFRSAYTIGADIP
ncbi:MAG: hypothetical protein JST33_05580 [Actinobacteria bacterium]|nr:hypothetical protein [Actinomycetota bacterium]